MSEMDLDIRDTLQNVAGAISFRPEERRELLNALRAELDLPGGLGTVSRPAWRWLSAAVVSVLMLISMAGPWQQTPTVAAQACVTPHVQVTPLPRVESVSWAARELGAQLESTPGRPGAQSAPTSSRQWTIPRHRKP